MPDGLVNSIRVETTTNRKLAGGKTALKPKLKAYLKKKTGNAPKG